MKIRALTRRLIGALMGIETTDEPHTDTPAEVVTRPDPDAIARDYASVLLREARDELTRADEKASILLAATGIAVGAVIAGMIAADWTPDRLGDPWSLIWRIASAFALVGIGALIWAIYPRTRHGKDDEAYLFYFRQAADVTTVEDLARELRRSSENVFSRSADQLWRVSRVVNAKYRAVRLAIWLLVVAAALAVVASLGSEAANVGVVK